MIFPSSTLQELASSRSPKDRAAIIADAAINSLPQNIGDIARVCAIFHWFDGDIIESLLPESGGLDAESIIQRIQRFPFVEKLNWGLVYHDSTRVGLLKKYRMKFRKELQAAASKAAAAYLKKKDQKSIIEAIYCLRVAENESEANELWQKLTNNIRTKEDWQLLSDVSAIQRDAELIIQNRSAYNTGVKNAWHLAHPYPMPPNFTGRISELKMLDNWLVKDKNRILVIRALGGFGKSSLAWQWINTRVNPSEWKKLVWWSFYEGDASFEHFIEETLKYLKLEIHQGQRSQVNALLEAMQSQRILLVLDGFERVLRAYGGMSAIYQGNEEKKENIGRDCININAELLLRSICSLPNIKSKVLMTTRLTPRVLETDEHLIKGCREEELKAMHKNDAVDFFRAQGVRGSRTEIESACKSYGYHPLSLRILAGLVINDYQARGDINLIKNVDLTNDIVQNKNHILKVAYSTLSKEAQNLLNSIACFRTSVNYDVLESIFSKPLTKDNGIEVGSKKNLDKNLSVLEKSGLLHWDRNNNKFDLHPIVRRYAYERLTSSARTNTHIRLVNYFTSVDTPTKIQTLDDLTVLIELYHHTVRAGRYRDGLELFREKLTAPLYFQFGTYDLIVELLSTFFSSKDHYPNRLRKKSDQAWVLNTIANAYSLAGQPLWAIPFFEQQIRIREKEGVKQSVAIGLTNIAIQQIAIGNLNEAVSNLQRSLKFCQEIGNQWEESAVHMELGRLISYFGTWDDAEKEFSYSIVMLENLQDTQAQSIYWAYFAVYNLLVIRDLTISVSKNEKVELGYRAALRALELAEESARLSYPVQRDFIFAQWLLGAYYRINDQPVFSESYLTEALTRDRAIKMVDLEANILLELARLRYDQKNYQEAKSLAEEALLITERCGYVLQGADVNLFLAQYTLEQEQDKAKAKQYAEEAKKLATCDGPPYYYKVAYEEAESFLEKLNT